jgi:2-phosphosulfolactate phosphatase
MKPFRVEVLLSPAELSEGAIREQQIVVIDVLRATTVIGVALAAGARRIVPAAGIEEAVALKAQIGPEDTLLCGEREGRPIPGFDLGNSPGEYRPESVAGRTLILASTNGSVLLSRSQPARRLLVAAFNTLGAVARRMAADGGDWTIVGSGKMGRPCLEDLACAGGLVARLDASGGRDRLPTDDLDLATDGARIARDIFERYHADIPGFLAETAHGRYLASIGFAADFAAAGAIDALDLVPEMIDGRIVDGARIGERNGPTRPARARRPAARTGATRG